MNVQLNRRQLLKQTAFAAAIPTIIPSTAFGTDNAPVPSERVNLGFIGVSGQGTRLLKNALYIQQARVVAVCDCFTSRRQAAINTIKDIYTSENRQADVGAKAYADFRELLAREDIDGVVIATPDHWHVPLAYYAVQAGKDVYVEKPLGVSVDDGFQLRQLVQDKAAVFQYGTQQRSDYYFRFACELVRNGYIGRLEKMDVWCKSMGDQANVWRKNFGDHDYTKISPPAQPVPADLDYNRWIGPAPMKPYSDVRVSRPGTRHIYDYTLGYIAGWGAHPLDIAQWGNDSDHTAPVHYEGTGTVPSGGLFDSISSWDMHCTYANGVKMHFMDHTTAAPVVSRYYPKMRDHGTTFHGDEGWITVRRGSIDFSNDTLRRVKFKDSEVRLYKSENHMANFVDCIKSRKKPISTIEAAVQSDLISHLSNAAIRLQRPIRWDPEKEKVIGNEEMINKIINRTPRSPWTL